MDEKERLLNEVKKLGEKTKDLKDFLYSNIFKELCRYYRSLGMSCSSCDASIERDMAICFILSNVEGIYVKGNLIHIMQSAYYTSLGITYDYDVKWPDFGFICVILKNKDRKYLENIRPQDGIIVYLDYEYDPKGITYYATKIDKMNKMYHPVKICPACKQIYDAHDNEHFCQFDSTTCDFCSSAEDTVSLIEVDNTDDLYSIIDKEDS